MVVKQKKQEVIFNYKKSNEYKSYHIDGIYGGILPTTNIWFDTFFEKTTFPEKEICEVDEAGKIANVTRVPELEDNEIIREMQVGFTMSLGTAKIIRKWLDEKIQIIENELIKTKK